MSIKNSSAVAREESDPWGRVGEGGGSGRRLYIQPGPLEISNKVCACVSMQSS